MLRLLGGHRAYPIVGAGGVHRSGWPHALAALSKYHDDKAVIGLDDYADSTFTWGQVRLDHHPSDNSAPWVGIFHHPVTISGPIASVWTETVLDSLQSSLFQARRKSLIGTVAMCPVLGEFLRTKLELPCLVLEHPTQSSIVQWKPSYAKSTRVLWQIGHYLRDSRLVYRMRLPKSDWQLSRMAPWNNWSRAQDSLLREKLHVDNNGGGNTDGRYVIETERLDADEYDQRLASCVMLTHTFGAAANNTIIECIVRAAPIITNRTESAEYYLGKDYPLFYDDTDQIADYLDDWKIILAAHEYLKQQDLLRFDATDFAARIERFCSQCFP